MDIHIDTTPTNSMIFQQKKRKRKKKLVIQKNKQFMKKNYTFIAPLRISTPLA